MGLVLMFVCLSGAYVVFICDMVSFCWIITLFIYRLAVWVVGTCGCCCWVSVFVDFDGTRL